jgi:hypothetical protein
MRPPLHGTFVGRLVYDLAFDGWAGVTATLRAPFGFYDSMYTYWAAQDGFRSDGATFPGWLRYIPTLVALLSLKYGTDGSQAFLLGCFLQTLVGFALNDGYMEAAVLHDAAYAEQTRPRYMADFMFFEAILTKARILWCDGKRVRGAITYVRAPFMYLGVVFGGWWPWFQHSMRLRRLRRAEG